MLANINLREQLILDLLRINAIRFGKFKLKSGLISPFYLDLRLLVSYPYLLELTAEVFWEEMRTLSFDVVIGVPYTGIPIATAIALKHNQSMIFIRKEPKTYGTGKFIEGEYHAGQKGILIDDVITNGESKFESITPLKQAQISVENVTVLLDRGQGGPELLRNKGYQCYSIFTINDIFRTLERYKRIDKKTISTCLKFITETRKEFLAKQKSS